MMERSFWIVWNPAGRNPTYKHFTEEKARLEANRLANLHPGQDFIVMEARAKMRKPEVIVTEYDNDRDLPF